MPQTATAIAARQRTPQQQRQYLEAIQPWITMQANIIGMQPMRYRMSPGGSLNEREIMWTPGSKEMYDQISQIIDQIGREHGGSA